MRRKHLYYLAIIFFLIFLDQSKGQLLEENFDYSAGKLTLLTSEWIETPTGSTDIEVILGSLVYSNYPSSGLGNKILLNGGATGRSGIVHNFTQQSSIGTTVYLSFLLSATSTTDMDTNASSGDYFANLHNSSISSARSFLYVRTGSSSSHFNLGIAKSSVASLSWLSTDLNVYTTYLIVVSYSFIDGTNNDIVKLWVNPTLSGSEPEANLSISSGADASDIGAIQFRQREFSGDLEIDGIRVATSWSEGPLPVELTSFTVQWKKDIILLNWSTATEINNFGFGVERKAESSDWETIGFVKGSGNCNSPKHYSFCDLTPRAGKILYRLKQIDNNGSYKFYYANEIEVNVDGYELKQNYPNPFNPLTHISYSLPVKSNVKLAVYDLLGREITVLVNSQMEAGIYNVEFDGGKLSSGIYYYALITNGFLQAKKLVLLK